MVGKGGKKKNSGILTNLSSMGFTIFLFPPNNCRVAIKLGISVAMKKNPFTEFCQVLGANWINTPSLEIKHSRKKDCTAAYSEFPNL